MATTAARRGCASALRRLAAARFPARDVPPVSRFASASAGRAFRAAPSWAFASSDASTTPDPVAASNGSDRSDAARRFCIVGSGPAGMYAADRLLAHYGDAARVDVLERLPPLRARPIRRRARPRGHQVRDEPLRRHSRRPASQLLRQRRARPRRLRRRARPQVRHPARSRPANNTSSRSHPPNRPRRPRSLSHPLLLPRYDGTILAYGCDGDRTLDVPGEALSGVLSAREFVGWFNGDPRCVAEKDAIVASALANPRGDTAVIFGLGNVAVDCARILLRDPDHLAKTDVCDHALRALRSSAIRRVALVGRRASRKPPSAPKELRELLNLPNVRVTVDEADMATEAEDEADLEASRPRRRAKDALEKATSRPPAGADADAASGTAKELAVKFLRSPRTFHPMDATDASERVGSVTLTVNRLEGPAGRRRAIATEETETLAGVSLALRSVGYRATPSRATRGSSPSTNPRVVENTLGRVATPAGRDRPTGIETDTTGTETSASGLYVCGWLKRGPTGIIGTNLPTRRRRWRPWWRTTPRARSRDPRASTGPRRGAAVARERRGCGGRGRVEEDRRRRARGGRRRRKTEGKIHSCRRHARRREGRVKTRGREGGVDGPRPVSRGYDTWSTVRIASFV